MPLLGGVEIRERRPRYQGEPRYKRLDFVKPRKKYYTNAEEWDLVRSTRRVDYETIHPEDVVFAQPRENRYRERPVPQVHQFAHHDPHDHGHDQHHHQQQIEPGPQPWEGGNQGWNEQPWQAHDGAIPVPPMHHGGPPQHFHNDHIPVPPHHHHQPPLIEPMHHHGGAASIVDLGPNYREEDVIYEYREPKKRPRSHSRDASVIVVPIRTPGAVPRSKSRNGYSPGYAETLDGGWDRGRSPGRRGHSRSISRPALRLKDDDLDSLNGQMKGLFGERRNGGYHGW